MAYFKAENRILRARLPKRIVATEAERRKLVRAGRGLGTKLRDLMTVVTYDTFRKWVRATDQARKQRPKKRKPVPGRPRTDAELTALVVRMRKETGFGYWILTSLRSCMARMASRRSFDGEPIFVPKPRTPFTCVYTSPLPAGSA